MDMMAYITNIRYVCMHVYVHRTMTATDYAGQLTDTLHERCVCVWMWMCVECVMMVCGCFRRNT